ncbi:hypothetical protein MKX01_004565 [Papaver californicum]|nr:hypothetical protein MKX01_004565 [Papaver californicum]
MDIKQQGVRVIVRERPFLDSERDSNSNPRSCISSEVLSTDEVSVLLKDLQTSRKECYKVDSFYGKQDDNVSQIFNEEISPLLQWIFQGSNAAVFAYGATGSGKTYTMQGTDQVPGLMTLSMSSVLSMCEISGCSAEISYYEVYMDRCYDLLEQKTKEISVLDDKDGEVQLRGLSTVPIRSMVEFHEVLSSVIQRRKVAHTGLNDVSSRSHGVLVIVVAKTCRNGDDSTSITTGKLNLIDLAGNEDNRRSCNEGIRIQESGKISQSLFALSNVIYALNNNKPRVPYRESKLTRILQDSLGGTSRSLMVACLNPGEYQESVYTVSLAARSRHFCNYVSSVQNPETPKVKVDMEEKLRAWLESKGKTKSTKRIAGLASPCASKTPIHMSSLKKRNLFQNSGKAACATYGRSVSKAKERRMLNFEATAVSLVNETANESGEDDKKTDNGCTDVLLSQACITDKFLEVSVKALEDPNENFMVVSLANGDGSKIAERGSHKDLVESLNSVEDHLEPFNKTGTNEWEEDGKETDTNEWEEDGKACILDKSLEEKMRTISVNKSESPLNSERVKTVTGSVRKALSPINSNVNMNLEDLPPKVSSCLFAVEQSTPRAPSILSHRIDEPTESRTPLDRFCARSSNLKTTLLEEYIAFLNAASKEQLLGLKGIGLKRAEYIIELREASPIKSLSDLENIGLSSKQV